MPLFFSPDNARTSSNSTSRSQSTSSHPDVPVPSSSSAGEEVTSQLFSPPTSNSAAAVTILDVSSMNQFGSAASSGRSSPVVTSGRTTPTALIGAVSEVGGTNVVNTNVANNNIAKFGRETGSKAYSADEHLALLSVLQSTPNSFNSGEGCDEWKAVYRNFHLSLM